LEEKLSRKSLDITRVADLHDLIGLRIILLFRRDLDTVCQLLNRNLKVLEQYDTSERLSENQFGYASTHLIITLPDAWLQVPTFAPLKGLVAEVQVRTAAQHAWAAASHVLQYKAEASVPASVRRSINRVSALLETVDLEFERVLEERQKYREAAIDTRTAEELNVDLLEKVLNEAFPEANKVASEDYDGVLQDLMKFGVDDSEKLLALIDEHKSRLLQADQAAAKQIVTDASDDIGVEERARANAGIWFSHTGLVRELLRLEFGTAYSASRDGTKKLITTKLGR
jgi:putative GTP pyrophosphokinase